MDFFISHADADLEWAEWIAAELEAAGYGVIVKAWDFRPGENALLRQDEALATCRHTICVLSEDYVNSGVATRIAAHYQELRSRERAVIPVKVVPCDPPPLMAVVIPIDLSGLADADEARRRLLAGVADRAERVARTDKARFPGAPPQVWELRGHRPDPYFTGRDDVLTALRRALGAGHPAAAVQVITGLGGLGKTELAVQYAFRHAAAYDLVWWIRAEDPATMRGDYVELAGALGLPVGTDDEAIAALRRELHWRRNWLLIFDNAEDPDELFSLLPERHPGHVLITARHRDWPLAQAFPLEVLPLPAAAEYLQRKGRITDPGPARELADALGCLPLALAQAASVIAGGMSAVVYLDLLRRQSPELFAESRTPDRDITLATSWQVSMDRLALRSSAAVALFRLSAFLAPDAIPLTRLTAVGAMPAELAEALTNPSELYQATAALREYSLAETTDGLLSVHRLVQAVTRAELGGDEPRWAALALAAIEAAFPADEQDPKAWPACEEVLAHALACTAHAARLRVDIVSTVRLLTHVVWYLLARGRLGPARRAADLALAAAKDLDDDDPVYLSCRSIHGQLLTAQGNLMVARAIQEEVYRTRTRVFGPQDPDTLRAGRDLVVVLDRLGESEPAAQLNDRLVEAFTAVLGPDDPETIAAREYLATLVCAAGHYTRARAMEEQVLKARTRVLGGEHPHTLASRANLGFILRAQGELTQARTIEEQLVETLKRVLGEEHPQTLTAMASLADTMRAAGNQQEAISLLTEILEIALRLFGLKHTMTTETAWRLVVNCGPHEARRRQVLIVRYLYWLGREPPGHLTANQKKINEYLKGKKKRK